MSLVAKAHPPEVGMTAARARAYEALHEWRFHRRCLLLHIPLSRVMELLMISVCPFHLLLLRMAEALLRNGLMRVGDGEHPPGIGTAGKVRLMAMMPLNIRPPTRLVRVVCEGVVPQFRAVG